MTTTNGEIATDSSLAPIEYAEASPEVRAIYDDIMATRKADWINHFWKYLAHDPRNLRRIWFELKEIMGPGALDPLTKELIYIAVSITNGCRYCIASHGAGARAKGMSAAQYGELLAVVGMANQTNRLAVALDVPVDARFAGPDPVTKT
jgi:AhpD family alkylhydroperoxidase